MPFFSAKIEYSCNTNAEQEMTQVMHSKLQRFCAKIEQDAPELSRLHAIMVNQNILLIVLRNGTHSQYWIQSLVVYFR